MTTNIQTAEELDAFYELPDPWEYSNTPDDACRRDELLSFLPHRTYLRTLDIGCGNGFVTFYLPGEKVIGIDLSSKAIQWAEQNRQLRRDSDRFELIALSLFDIPIKKLGQFDLVCITGILYPQYIGKSFSVVREIINQILEIDGILVSCHINDWNPPRFPYHLLDTSLYPYRNYTHRLEIYRK